MEARAVLLAVSIAEADRQALESEGIEVHALNKRFARLKDLVEAGLDLRRKHPRLPLLVSAPERMLRRLERRYPPLIDVAVPNTSPVAILAALKR